MVCERATSTSGIGLRQVADAESTAVTCDLFHEYARAIGVDLEFQGFSAELAALPAPYVPPRGALLLAYADDAVAGCVGLRPLDARTGGMKRLYVRPPWRGSGLGRRLVAAVIQTARAAGYAELRLDTLPSMEAAQSLYRQLGFISIPAYNRHHLPGTRFYSLALDASRHLRDATACAPGSPAFPQDPHDAPNA